MERKEREEGGREGGREGRTYLIGQDYVSYLTQVLLGEDEANVALDVIEDLLQLGDLVEVSTNRLPTGAPLWHYNSESLPTHTIWPEILAGIIFGRFIIF